MSPITTWMSGEDLKVQGKKRRGARNGRQPTKIKVRGGLGKSTKSLTPLGMKHVQTVRSYDGPGARTKCHVCGAPITVEVKKFTNGKEFLILDLGGGPHLHQDG